jgi:hypothetical protein
VITEQQIRRSTPAKERPGNAKGVDLGKVMEMEDRVKEKEGGETLLDEVLKRRRRSFQIDEVMWGQEKGGMREKIAGEFDQRENELRDPTPPRRSSGHREDREDREDQEEGGEDREKAEMPFLSEWMEIQLLKGGVLYQQARFEDAMSSLEVALLGAPPDQLDLYVYVIPGFRKLGIRKFLNSRCDILRILRDSDSGFWKLLFRLVTVVACAPPSLLPPLVTLLTKFSQRKVMQLKINVYTMKGNITLALKMMNTLLADLGCNVWPSLPPLPLHPFPPPFPLPLENSSLCLLPRCPPIPPRPPPPSPAQSPFIPSCYSPSLVNLSWLRPNLDRE